MALAQGQLDGTLAGTVVDNVGVVPGATVTATQVETNVTRSTTTNDQGVFRIAALPPGRYTLKVEMDGFKPIAVAEFNLLAGELRALGRLVMAAGAVSESVTVTAAVTPVQVSDSSRAKTVTSDDFKNIQMKGRDPYGVMAILPGVQDTNLNRDFTTLNSAIAITINGMAQSKDIRLDGINAQDEGGGSNSFVNLNIDAIGEVQVISNGYTAENGRKTGGMISITTKSGTNQFRGSAWYNGRRDRFNANDYFRKLNNQAKPLYEVNISGYTFGGPAVIPGLFDSRTAARKLYFFVSQEYTADASPTTTLRGNLPTDAERKGDFSQTYVTSGALQPIVDPQTGQAFPGNMIPDHRIHPLGRAMLNLLPFPNGILNLQAGQQFTSNSAYDTSPEHGRLSNVVRVDNVWSDRTRLSFRFLRDREDTWQYNGWTPGTGHLVNKTPGVVLASTITQVLQSTVVNSIIVGWAHNRWGFLAGDENSTRQGGFDYRTRYATALGIDAPRLRPFGPYSDPPKIARFGGPQQDEWPYAPIFSTSGGNRSNLAGFQTGRFTPVLNFNGRLSFQDDLSVSRGRHNFKFGFFTEINQKTEPGSQNYLGNFNFGHDASNPFNTGNGYANMLLGYYSTYTELTRRVDKAVRHWQTEGYAQDSWRLSPRLTLDYGVRLVHAGSQYEIRDMHTGFFPDEWEASQAARVYKQVCVNGPGNLSCSAANQRTIDPANPSVLLPGAFNGNLVPGSGSVINGVSTDGIPGKKPGTYVTFPGLRAAPRLGVAWDVMGDGKTAVRASTGLFYEFPASGNGFNYRYAGGCPVSCSKVIRWANFDAIATAATGGVNFVETPTNVNAGGLFDVGLGHSYNAHVAFQRDVGFNTVAEIAWVGNYAWNFGREIDQNRLPLYIYGNVNNLFNGAAANANYLRTLYGRYPGMGTVTQFIPGLYSQILKYNSMQINVVRRLSNGLQMGMAYTLAKGEGFQGYDVYTDELGGADAVRARYWGPTEVDRRHNLVVNYSYDIPGFSYGPAIVRQLMRDWQVSGVVKLQSGAAVTPSCSSNNSGIANTLPSLTEGLTASCQLTGEPINLDLSQKDPDNPHFNLAAFAMAQPTDTNGDGVFDLGNFGSTGLVGLLRNPTVHVWDLTLSRRFPIAAGGTRGIRLQLQVYNLFNQVQFTTLNAAFTFTGANNATINSANTGKYTNNAAPNSGVNLAPGLVPPRIVGATVRFDW
jgi:hypothetical protein